MPEKSIDLKVADPEPTHVGRNIVTLDRETKRQLEITSGDIVEIAGPKKKTAAIVWPARAEDEGKLLVRMDNLIRHNAGVGIGEKVTVIKCVPKEAKKVVLAPTQEIRIIASGYDRILKKTFLGRPLTFGDNVWISVFGTGFVYKVIDTTPRGAVKVTDFTQIVLKEAPVKGEIETVPSVSYDDIGGLDEPIRKVREMIELPMRHPEIFRKLGIVPPKGVLLYGPPGTGKTLLAKAVAHETNAHFKSVNAPEIMSKFVGEAEERIRQIFKEAEENAPSIIFIDEIDAIAPKRETVMGEVERRVVAQILALMDGLEARGNVIVIAATNRVNSLDEALRRPGRFDREIEFPVPDKNARKDILLIHTRGMPLAKDVELDYFASITHGFVGADLAALGKEAAMKALRRYLPKFDLEAETIPQEILESLEVNKKDFQNGLKDVQPSALREVTIEIPNVKWSDVGDLENAKRDLKEAVEWPLKHPESFKQMGIKPPAGILLFGPPGCGKTLLAKAVASESEANFISIKGPELLSMWVGESLPFDEELLVFDGKNIFREKIGLIVEESRDLQVVTFDNDGKALFSKITGFVKHPSNGKMLEISTKTGRKIRVTDKHSLFSLVENEIEAVAPSQLVEGKSVLAVPSKIPNISLCPGHLNLLDLFSGEKGLFVHSPQIAEIIKSLGYAKSSELTGLSKKYLYDVAGKNLPVSLGHFCSLFKASEVEPDLAVAMVSRSGARNVLPVLLPLSDDFFELIGLWVAEGDFNSGVPRLAMLNPEIIHRTSEILGNLGLKYSLIEGNGVVINSTTLTLLFGKLGLETGAFNKRIPDCLLVSSTSAVCAFLRGYFSGDGTITSNGRSSFVEATTVSRQLANDLMFLFLKLGIVASCAVKKEWSGSTSYRVQVFGIENLKRFGKAGFIDAQRNGRLQDYISSVAWARSSVLPVNPKIDALLDEAFVSYPSNSSVGKGKLREALCLVDIDRQKYSDLWKLVEADVFWDTVKKIEEIPYDGFVYDVSVEPCQNFVAGFGGIFAHNSEKGVRNVFKKARQVAPCIVFFDEIDALAPKRGLNFGSHVSETVVNQLLTELDGIEQNRGVIFMAATNRPDLIDPGLMRPGRIDKLVRIEAPSKGGRLEIFKVHTKNVMLDNDVSLEALVEKTEGFNGADIEGLIRTAALVALRKSAMKPVPITMKDFEKAFSSSSASITQKVEDSYTEFEKHIAEFKPNYVG